MSYFEPYIDAEGYHFPTYGELMEYILSQYKKIYGESVYLGNDSQDYQFISIFAKMLYDLFCFFEVILNNQAPSSAVGSGLDMRVAWNGIQRKPASFSTCDLQLSGVVGTVIEGGVVRDTAGNLWNLPEKVILTESPLTVSAQSQEIGAVAAPANTINSIVTPVAGWTSVNNELPASTGSAIETDEELKARRIDSVSIVAVNMRDSMKAAILAAENVSKCEIYENDTNITDDNGIPPHSVACVVEGGDSAEIAKIIFNKKGPGTGTYAEEDSAGFVSETVTSSSGLPCTILFCRPVEVNVKIYISIAKTPYYNTTTQANIQNKLKEYFSKVALGTDIYASSIIAVASQAIDDIYNPEFRLSSTVLMAKNEEELSDRNRIEIKFNETAVLSDLTIAGGL